MAACGLTQIPIDPGNGDLVSGDIKIQTQRVLDNVKAILDSQKLTFANVVKSTVFLTNLSDFAGMNEVYAKYFTSDFPARSTIQVAGLPKGARVEIEAVAMSEALPKSPKILAAPVDISPASPL